MRTAMQGCFGRKMTTGKFNLSKSKLIFLKNRLCTPMEVRGWAVGPLLYLYCMKRGQCVC